MTLDRHRSKMMPDIDFSGDGNLFITDREGTFPLRGHGGGKKRSKDPRISYSQDASNQSTTEDNDDTQTYRSFDPKRAERFREKRRRYRQRQSEYEREVQQLTGTWSSGGTASLQRRLRRNRDRRSTEFPDRDTNGMYAGPHYPNYMGTMSSIGKHKKSTAIPRMPEYPGSLNRSKAAKSMDVKAIQAYNQNMMQAGAKVPQFRNGGRPTSNRPGSFHKRPNGSLLLIQDISVPIRKKISEERLPSVYFVVLGLLLAPVAIVKILFTYWHLYFASAWTAALLLIFGILGIVHRKDYLSVWKNGTYIVLGFLSACAAGATCCLIFFTEVPIIRILLDKGNKSTIASTVAFTNNFKSVISTGMSTDVMVNMTVVLDFISLLICVAGFIALTASLMAVSNHWDASYTITSECDHRGKPRFFNPLEQIGLGHATIVLGVLCIQLAQTMQSHYYTPVYCGGFVMIAGLASMCHGKRLDHTSLGLFAMFWELLALAACSGATVFTTLMLVDEITIADKNKFENNPSKARDAVAGAIAEAIFLFILMFNVVFVVGILFRQLRKVCCAHCDNSLMANP